MENYTYIISAFKKIGPNNGRKIFFGQMNPNLVRAGQMAYIIKGVYEEKSLIEDTKRKLLSKEVNALG